MRNPLKGGLALAAFIALTVLGLAGSADAQTFGRSLQPWHHGTHSSSGASSHDDTRSPTLTDLDATLGAEDGTVATAPDASPIGAAMPVGDLPGWHQVMAQDFDKDVVEGAFPGPYATSWMSYNGFPDTSGVGFYDQSIISVDNGSLNLAVHTDASGRPLGAAPIPLVGDKWGGQTYGRFSVRMRADSMANYGAAFLLWSDANDWNDGEVDFPEGNLDGTAWAHNHCPGNPAENCLAVDTGVAFTSWHTYTIDWTPTSLSYEIDGQVVARTETDIPTKPLHWVMQVGTNGTKPDPSVSGNLQIDWATVYTYNP